MDTICANSWFNKSVATNLYLPNTNFYHSNAFKKDRNLKHAIFKTNDICPINIEKNKPFDYISAFDKICDGHIKNIQHIKNNNDDVKKYQTKIKSLNTKFEKNLSQINTVTRVNKIHLQLTDIQKTIIKNWINECRNVYNYCVSKLENNNKYFNNGYKKIKVEIFNELYGDSKKPVPYDILTDEVRIFCSNLKSCFTNLKNKNITHFKMNKKLKTNTNYSLLIPSKSISKNGIFITMLNKINNFNIKNLPSHDCRLFYNYKTDNFTLICPIDINCKIINNREPIVSIDPGERKFISFYGLNSYGYIGKNIRKPILKLKNSISKYQKILANGLNKNGDKIRNQNQIKNKISKNYKKIKNIIKELHNQTAYYLCNNYDKILLPKFETQKMISNKRSFKEYKTAFINEGKTLEEQKAKAKIFTKKIRLNKNVKYVLGCLSHFSFKQHLQSKSLEYGCQLKIVSEEFTSKTCTNCGYISDKYSNRIKTCTNCNYSIDRDYNGARNILIKNLHLFKYEAIKPMVTYKPTDNLTINYLKERAIDYNTLL
jgi:transposase